MNRDIIGLDPIILMVEAKKDNQEKVKKSLGAGFSYECVKSARGCMEFLKKYRDETALIMINLDEEGLDGFKLMRELEKGGFLFAIPVIAMSENPSEEIKNRAYNIGVTDYLNLVSEHASTAKRIRNTMRTFVRARTRDLFQNDRDPLTAAFNLSGLRKSFARLVEEYPDTKVLVLYADIRNFKFFNTNFGFDEGNRLLVYWCNAIRRFFKEGDFLGRISADQLVIVIPMINGHKEEKHFNQILKDVREHFEGRFGDFTINMTAGIYEYDPAAGRNETFDDMIGYARQAQLSVKKKDESGIVVYTKDMWEEQQRKLEINGHIDAAIEDGEILVYLQPQYNYVSGELIGAECLCRWQHKTMGFISPSEFIPALEETGNIYKLDRYVWEVACKCIRKWKDEGHPLRLSVNVSRKDIGFDDLPAVFLELVKKYDIEPAMLRLEITESAYMDNSKMLTELIRRFATLGFSVEMDDFGSGFSSLNLLHDVEVDVLKLDMGFLNDKNASLRSGNIINAIVRMAHVLDIGVLAEGVETAEQAEFLKNIGCLHAQGYYFSKPIPIDEFEKLFDSTEIEEKDNSLARYQQFNIQELFDRRSSGFFIFNNCMGPGAIFEFDKNALMPVAVNDEFIETIGWTREDMERNRKNILNALPEKNGKALKRIFERGIKNGISAGEIYLERNNTHLHVFLRKLSKKDDAELLFCQLTNISREKALEDKIIELQKVQQAQMEFMPCGTFKCENSLNGHVEYISDSLVTMFGYRKREEFEKRFTSYIDFVYEADRANVADTMADAGAGVGVIKFDHRIERADGSVIWVYHIGRIMTDSDGKEWLYVVLTDIDMIKKQNIERRKYELKLRAVLEIPNIVLYEYNPETDRMTLSVRTEEGELHERTADNYLADLHKHNWIHEDYVGVYRDVLKEVVEKGGCRSVYARAFFKDGNYYLCKYTFSATSDENGNVDTVIGRAERVEEENDKSKAIIGENKKLIDKLTIGIHTESMTKLYNHEYAIQRIDRSAKRGESGTVFMIDFDNFMNINDKYGHGYGDKVIVEFAKRLKKAFRDEDVVGRYGGDEFICYMPCKADRTLAIKKAEAILRKAELIAIDDDARLNLSIGIAINDGTVRKGTELVELADRALYRVKNNGKGTYGF